MNNTFTPVKIGHIKVKDDLYKKLKISNLCIKYLNSDYLFIFINEEVIETVRNRKVRPEVDKSKDKDNTLLGLRIIMAESEIYYDEDVYQFYLEAQFEEYTIALVQAEGGSS